MSRRSLYKGMFELKTIRGKEKQLFYPVVALPRWSLKQVLPVVAPLGIRTGFRGTSRKWTLMNGAKDKIPTDTPPGVVYAIGCLDCEQVYVGETARTSRERLKEHRCHTRTGKVELSAVAQHVADTDHKIHWKPRFLTRERTTTARKVREALIIHRLDRKGGGMHGYISRYMVH